MVMPKTDLELARTALAEAEAELERAEKALANAEAATTTEVKEITRRDDEPQERERR